MIKKNWVLFFFLLINTSVFSQTILEKSATYYTGGINSPWSIGMDYDIGFGKLFSVNFQLTGGVSSQVNRASTFGDVFFGELQIGPRLYMNKFDTWAGLYLTTVVRVGIYNIPIRTKDNPLTTASKIIINRSTMLQYGLGVYIGYKWQRDLVTDMENFPFTLVLEPYLGWTLDFFQPLSAIDGFNQNGKNIGRFTVGLTFKIGFYTHKKSKATLEAEARAIEEEKAEENTTTNTQNINN